MSMLLETLDISVSQFFRVRIVILRLFVLMSVLFWLWAPGRFSFNDSSWVFFARVRVWIVHALLMYDYWYYVYMSFSFCCDL
jgi:hypothetical protein